MKYDLRKIMKRAWEIKELVDQKTKNSLLNRNIFRELKKEEKALFSECLKEAWKEAKRASELEKELKIKTAGELPPAILKRIQFINKRNPERA